MSQHSESDGEDEQSFDLQPILTDRSPRSKLDDQELEKLHEWLSDRTTVFRRGKRSNLSNLVSNEIKDLHGQHEDSENGRETTSTNEDTFIDGLVSDTHAQFLVPYDEACRRLGLDPQKPKAFIERDFVLRPHQVTGICSALLRESDALPFHILADDCGLGKTCQILHLIHYHNTQMVRRGATDYKVSLILAPQSTCTNWLDDASRMFPPGPRGLQMWTFYSKELRESTPNYSKMPNLLAACARLKRDDPITGRTIILSTYNTFIKHGLPINKARREARHVTEKIQKSYRPTDFAPEDFDLVWDLQTERVIVDEGHRAKNPKTKTNAALRTLTCNNFWLISATLLHNSIEDILGITKLLKKHLAVADLGILRELDAEVTLEIQRDIDALSAEAILEMYENANKIWKYNVDSWKTARTFLRSQLPSDIKPWYNSQEKRQQNSMALEKNLNQGRIKPYVAKEVIGLVLRMVMIRRTRTSVESILDQDGKTIFVTPDESMAPCIVSTVDLAPGFAEHEFYQRTLARKHQDRMNVQILTRHLQSQNDHALDSWHERLSIAGTAHPIIAQDILKLIALREADREEAKEQRRLLKEQGMENDLQAKKRKKTSLAEPFDDDELESCKWNKDTLVWKDYLLLGKARTFDDRYAAHWYLKTPKGTESNVPSCRIELLKYLLVDSTKYRYMAMALIKAKITKKRVIIFFTYPVQQIFLETVACLLDTPVVSMCSADSSSVQRSKIELFNDPTANVFAFLSTSSIAGQSLNLHQCCDYMIQCDVSNSLNTMLQMKGRIDCVGQTRETLVEILALDYTADVHRQGCIAGKIIPVLSAMMEHNYTNAILSTEKKNQILQSIGEQYVRISLGQSCSRAMWETVSHNYEWAFSNNQEDPQIARDHGCFDKLLEKYRKDYQASNKLGEIYNKVFTFEVMTDKVSSRNENEAVPHTSSAKKKDSVSGRSKMPSNKNKSAPSTNGTRDTVSSSKLTRTLKRSFMDSSSDDEDVPARQHESVPIRNSSTKDKGKKPQTMPQDISDDDWRASTKMIIKSDLDDSGCGSG